MSNPIPSWEDSEELNRLPPYEPEADDEDDDPRTEVEKRLAWLCEEWQDCIVDDTYESWHDLRMEIHGARMALNHCHDRHDDMSALLTLSEVAFQISLTCITEGKYLGESK